MNKNRIFYFSFAIFLSFNAHANVDKTFKTSANINKTCKITADNIEFGLLDPTIQNHLHHSSIQVFCNKNTTYSLTLNYGTPHTKGYYASGKPNGGVMTGLNKNDFIIYGIQLTNNFNYDVFNWTTSFNATASGQVDVLPLTTSASFGYMDSKRYPAPDNYKDESVITLSF